MKASDSVENRIPDLSSSESISKDPSTTNAPLNEIRSNEVNQYLSENQDTQDIGCKMFCMGVALNLENLVTLAILPYI